MLTPAQRAFLDGAFVATVTTVRRDGSLHGSVVWVGADDGAAVFNTLRSRAKARHLEHDPRVSLVVVDAANPYRWLSLSGTAELREEGAQARVDRFAKRYVGQDGYPPPPGETWVTARIAAERIESQGI
jgi:PPOX class probable F420-dependent enzyme